MMPEGPDGHGDSSQEPSYWVQEAAASEGPWHREEGHDCFSKLPVELFNEPS